MYVYISLLRWELYKKENYRIATLKYFFTVPVAYALFKQLTLDIAAVYKKYLIFSVGASLIRRRDIPVHSDSVFCSFFKMYKLFSHRRIVYSSYGIEHISPALSGKERIAVIYEPHSYIRVSQRHFRNKVYDQCAFGVILFQEFHPGRSIEKQILDDDRSTLRASCRLS